MQAIPESKWFPVTQKPVSHGPYLIRMKSPYDPGEPVYPLALGLYQDSKWHALDFSTYEFTEVNNVIEWTYIP